VRRPLESLVKSSGLPAGFLVVVDALDEADRYDGTKLSELIAGFGALDRCAGCCPRAIRQRWSNSLGGRCAVDLSADGREGVDEE